VLSLSARILLTEPTLRDDHRVAESIALEAKTTGQIAEKERTEAMEVWTRVIENLFGRLDGPLHFRFIVQPSMAIIFAVIDGVKDAKLGRPAYFWTMVKNPDQRRELLKIGWKRIGKIFILAVILDVIYQIKELHWFYPGETLIVAILLAIMPYLVVRGPINRIIGWWRNKAIRELQAKRPL
jgi:hypothetical protein